MTATGPAETPSRNDGTWSNCTGSRSGCPPSTATSPRFTSTRTIGIDPTGPSRSGLREHPRADPFGQPAGSAVVLQPSPAGSTARRIAAERGVSSEREMELLAQVGHDLPGAVTIEPDGGPLVESGDRPMSRFPAATTMSTPDDMRFSLAGVGPKYSMLRQGLGALTLPAAGRGDWIVKLPTLNSCRGAANESLMMSRHDDRRIRGPGDSNSVTGTNWPDRRTRPGRTGSDRPTSSPGRPRIQPRTDSISRTLAQVRRLLPGRQIVGTFRDGGSG